jgi:hypothetical protein
MTEAQRLRVLELAVQAGSTTYEAVETARRFERYLSEPYESVVVPSANSTPDSGLAST